MFLLLIKFGIDFEYEDDGSREDRLVVQRLGEVFLNDRYGGKITVQPRDNTIRIGPDAFPNGERTPGRVITIK
jgi:hypothetical protein